MTESIQETSTAVQIAEGKIDSMGQRVAKNSIKDNFNDMRGAAQGLSGAIGILSLGFDSQSKTGEILRNVMVGLTVAQTTLTIVEQKADLQRIASVIQTKALAAAQWAYNSAVSAFTVVGAVALIAALAKVFMARKKDNDEAQKAIDQQKEWEDMQENRIKQTLAGIESLNKAFSNQEKRMNDILVAESKGVDQSKERINLIRDEIGALQTALDLNDDKNKANQDFGQFNKLLIDEEVKAINSLIFARKLELNQID